MTQTYAKAILQITLSLIFTAMLSSIYAQELPAVIISEFLSSNNGTISDEDGEFSDWIEIKNNSTETVNLQGWGLSDDDTKPFKWTFPTVNLEAGQHLLVWASGNDRKPDQTVLNNAIRQEMFLDLSGTKISDLTGNPDYPDKPSYVRQIKGYFEADVDINDNYGQRMHGLLKAPETGNYFFWISSDDNGELYLSSNNLQHNVSLIASVPEWTNSREWDKYDSQKSAAVQLTAGEYYYISALMKEEGGGDNLAVGWQLPSGAIQRPMPASHIYNAPGQLHTSFAISAGGEPILLTNPQGTTIHRIDPIALESDISYGIKEGETDFSFFSRPTPGLPNTTPGFSEILEGNISFSQPGGFYTEAFELSLSSSDPETTIYYTLDGSEPKPENIEGSTYQYKNNYPGSTMLEGHKKTLLYTEPIQISDRSAEPYKIAGINTTYANSPPLPGANIYKGTVVRAKAIKADALTLHTETHSYFISPRGNARYDLPVVSISTNEDNFFDYESGIYVAGKYFDEWAAANTGATWDDGRPANYNQRGKAWEKPAHFEYFPKNGDPVYKHDIGIRVHGGWSRAFPRKSLRLYARNEYGTGNTFTYPFFGELPARGDATRTVSEFRRLILRNSGNDFNLTLYRDALMQDLAKDLPLSTMAYNPVIHFVNGEYWGIINMRERYDQHYLASHYNLSSDDVAILDAWGNVDEGLPEDRNRFWEIANYAQNNNIAISSHYQWIAERVDVDNLAHYYAVQIYFYNTDWPQNNMTLWRYRNGVYSPDAQTGHDGRWRWMLYDTDFGMNIWGENQFYNGLKRVIDEANDPSSIIFKRLLLNTDFKNKFINIVADQLNSCFKPDYINKKVDEYNVRLASSRNEHYMRWGSGTDTGNSIKNFADQRPAYVMNHTGSQFGLSTISTLTVNKFGGGGVVKINSLTINGEMAGLSNSESPFPWSGSYFNTVPLSLAADDEPGYRFSHWIVNGLKRYEKSIEVVLTGNTDVSAYFNAAEYQLIHYWHFNNLPEGNLSPFQADYSLSEAQVSISYPGTGDGYMDRVNDGSEINLKDEVEAARALRVRNPSDTRHLELQIPTSDFEDIKLSYAVTRTSSGAQQQNIWYRSTAESDWTLFRENILISEVFQLIELDFSKISDANDSEEFCVKIEFAGTAASNMSGNNQIDNLAVEGYRLSTSLDEPKTSAIFNIFPLPAHEIINIASSQPLVKVVLYNISGQTIISQPALGHSHKINVSDLSGIYILELVTNNEIKRQKIVVK